MKTKTVYFRIIFVDEDNLRYGISDVIVNDIPINDRTVKLQQQGKKVRIFTGTNLYNTYDKVPSIQYILNRDPLQGYKYDSKLQW